MGDVNHWDSIYANKGSEAVSWFAPRLGTSLGLIEECRLESDCRVIDVGAGASTLADDLINIGIYDVTLLDLSNSALEISRQRLLAAGSDISRLSFIVGDLTDPALSLGQDGFDLWHDRATFHFLTDEDDRAAYIDKLGSVKLGGHAVIATFGPNGPDQCCGPPMAKYSPDELSAEIGPQFELRKSATEIHTTPLGAEQEFIYCLFERS